MNDDRNVGWVQDSIPVACRGSRHKMWAIPLICSFLTLHSTSSAAGQLTFKDLPNELQHIIVEDVDFCEYFEALHTLQGAPANTDFGMTMLPEAAKKEASLSLDDDKQRVEKQRILKSVRTFARLYSRLPVVFKETEADVNVDADAGAEELGRWATVFESSYETCSSFSESQTWRQACMAGLFGRNTLITLLPYLSKDFCAHNKALLLQTACFIGDIDSLKAIVESLVIPREDVLNMVSELEIVFSGSVSFFEELSKFLPNLMKKRLVLIREAINLQRLGIFTRVLQEAKPVKLCKLNQIFDSFTRPSPFQEILATFTNWRTNNYVLQTAAKHGHLPIIKFLWPVMEAIRSNAEVIIIGMMAEAGRNNHRSVLEFLLWHSGALFEQMAQDHVRTAFETAVERGNISIMKFLTGKDKAGNLIAPELRLTSLSWWTLFEAIKTTKNWNGVKYLVLLKKWDYRFRKFVLVDQKNTALILACGEGDYNLVRYLLRTKANGKFRFPHTDPAVNNNTPLYDACAKGDVRIVGKLLELDESGNYIYKGVDPSARNYECLFIACSKGHLNVVKHLLRMKDGDYVLPKMKNVDLCEALSRAIRGNHREIVNFLRERTQR